MADNVFLFRLIIIYLFIHTYVHGLCRSRCECSSYKMICEYGDIPTHIPYEIKELFIEHFDWNDFDKSQCKNVQHIQKLDIQADHGTTIPPEGFDQFTNLTYLGLHGKEITFIHPDAFVGLNKLVTLNLSSNPLLYFYYISKALNAENRGRNSKVLPNLLSLSVAKVKTSIANAVNLDGYFFRSVAGGRKLKHLDISNLNILRFDFREFQILCNSVEFVDFRNSVVGTASNFVDAEACRSLRTLDISGSIIPALRVKFNFKTLHFFCESFNFYTYMDTILANDVNMIHHIEINKYSLDMSTCPLQIQKVSVVKNKIKWINMTVQLHETTKKSIFELNMSNNGLEYLSPLALSPSGNIRILDLSKNKLNVMQENYTKEFERLFWAQLKLRYLNISFNSLSNIPKQTISKNTLLKVLDISYNNLKSLDFSVKQLVSIEKLIASHNKILTIEQDIRMDLQMLLYRSSKDNADTNATLLVSLEGNQFKCSCDKVDMQLTEWLYSTEIIDENETLTCILEKDLVDIRGNGLAQIKHFCRIQTIKKIAGISTPIVFTVVLLSITFVVVIKRRRTRKLMIRDVIAQIETGTFPLSYLAFLSYCSEDTDLVMDKLYPQFCEHLSVMTHSNNTLVCLGDINVRPGFPIRDEVMRCVEESSVFIAIISRNFCRSNWCNLEIGEAYDQKKPIVMLMIEYVEKELMDHFLLKIFNRYTHATWKPDNNGGHIEPEWNIFCRSIIELAGNSTANANYV